MSQADERISNKPVTANWFKLYDLWKRISTAKYRK